MGKTDKRIRSALLSMVLCAVLLCTACGQKGKVSSSETSSAAESTGVESAAETSAAETSAAETSAAGKTAAEKAAAESTAAESTAEEAQSDESAAESAADTFENTVPDYSVQDNWAYYAVGEEKEADLFFVCPTVDTNDEYNMSLDDTKMREHFVGALNMERGIYEENARMYAPYYRQAAMKVYGLGLDERERYLERAYGDVSAAFAYYLEHENDGRPIILAGFSQGADMCYRLLAEYFGDETLREQLIAAYCIGWPCTEEMVEQYPQISPAQSAEDLGTVISFDCEAPEVEETFIYPAGQKGLSINPLNWKTDGTVADKSENLGACFMGYDGSVRKEEAGLCGCYIDEERGALKVTDVDPADYAPAVPGLPEGAYHIYDYQFFYRNLQENVGERVSLYMEAVNVMDAAA